MKSSELKTIRSTTGLSREKFSRELGISSRTLEAWEYEKNPIPEWGSNLVKLTFPKNS